jgi:glucose-6-phosphate isomerase
VALLAWALSCVRCSHHKVQHHAVFQDAERCGSLTAEADGILLDFSRQLITGETCRKLEALAAKAGLHDKIKAMAEGKHINVTEDRAVGHMALRAPKGATMNIDGENAVAQVCTAVTTLTDD